MSPTLPVPLVCKMVSALLYHRMENLKSLVHSPKGRDSARPGRLEQVEILREQLKAVQAFRPDPARRVDGMVASLLCAWAYGSMEALGELEHYLVDQKHSQADRVAGLHCEHLAEAVRLLLT